MSDNPFDRYDLDPLASAEALTERLRELASDAEGEEADAIRAVWEHLTLHAGTRLVQALTTFSDAGRDAVPAPPARTRPAPPDLPRAEPALPRLLEPTPRAASALDPTTTITEDPLLDEGPR